MSVFVCAGVCMRVCVCVCVLICYVIDVFFGIHTITDVCVIFYVNQRQLDPQMSLLCPSSAKLTLDRQEIIIMVGSPACEFFVFRTDNIKYFHMLSY